MPPKILISVLFKVASKCWPCEHLKRGYPSNRNQLHPSLLWIEKPMFISDATIESRDEKHEITYQACCSCRRAFRSTKAWKSVSFSYDIAYFTDYNSDDSVAELGIF